MKKNILSKPVLIVILVLIILSALALLIRNTDKSSPTTSKTDSWSVPALDHVVIIVEENKPYAGIMQNTEASYIRNLANKYTYASNYFATDHPSEPNYLEIASGVKSKVRRDCTPLEKNCSSSDKSIADEIEATNKTWKAYQEGMPSPCYLDNVGTYRPKHNPFIYFENIRLDKNRCNQHDVPYSELATDLRSTKTTPNYIFITPDICNDMHDCSIDTGDKWLEKEVPKILNSPAFTQENSLLVITWDEDDGNVIGGYNSNHIPTLYIGPVVKNGYITKQHQDHYALYRTAVEALRLRSKPYQSKQVVTDIFK